MPMQGPGLHYTAELGLLLLATSSTNDVLPWPPQKGHTQLYTHVLLAHL